MIETSRDILSGIPLLETKLYVPGWRPSLVSRPRLIERMQEGMERKLTLVAAPAGFGKTTLLAEWLADTSEGERTAGWVSLDQSEKLDLVRSLGAERVIDYTREDFTQSGERYDLIFDVASNLSLSRCKRALTPAGIYIVIGHDHFGKGRGRFLGSLPQAFRLMALSPFVSHLPSPEFTMTSKKETMAILKDLLEARELTPVIDRTYPLREASLAMMYLESGNARGKILITP